MAGFYDSDQQTNPRRRPQFWARYRRSYISLVSKSLVGMAKYDCLTDLLKKAKKKSKIFCAPEAVAEDLERSVDKNFRPMLQPRQSPLKGEVEGNTSEQPSDFKFRKIAQPINISFKGLSLYLKSNQQKILSNVSGSMEHSRITAVMGPSGAGISLVIF